MFQAWRWKMRAAEQALAQGRPQEAARRLQQDGLLEFLPGQRLAEQTARQLAQQARELLAEGEVDAAWNLWDELRPLAGDAAWLHQVRHQMVGQALGDVQQQLVAGNLFGAAALMKKMSMRHLAADDLAQLDEVRRRLEAARDQAARGKFAEAAENVAAAQRVRPECAGLDALRERYSARGLRQRELLPQLHRALAAEQWTEAIAAADALLELAPQMPLALEARRRAWATVGARVSQPPRFAETQHWKPSSTGSEQESRMVNHRSHEKTPPPGSRFLLWIDAVGGFLVCLEPDLVIGQAVPGHAVDLPILGDLSRQHARIRRQGDGYVIEPLAAVRVRGQQISGPEPLVDGDEIQLGEVVRLRFRQPHALSATARLDFISRHRTPLAADAILLLAESCVLGPRKSNHVLCRDWTRDVIVYRKDDRLYCRTMDALEIDGQAYDGRGALTLNSRVSGEDFSLSLEPI